MSIQMRVQTVDVQRALASAPKIINGQIVDSMRRIGVDWMRHMQESFKGGGKNARGGSSLYSRSGKLRGSVIFKLNRGRRSLLLLVGNKATPYAGIQEDGGVVRPKRRKYLTVPLPNALTQSGVLKGGAKLRIAGGRRTRSGKMRTVFRTDKGETFIFKSKKGNLIVAVKPDNRKKVNLKRDSLYVLKKSIKVRARLGAWDSARLDGPRGPKIKHELDAGIVRALRMIDAKGKL